MNKFFYKWFQKPLVISSFFISIPILYVYKSHLYSFVRSLLIKENEKKEEKVEKKDKSKSIADLTKSSKKIDGLFPIFQDTINGKLKMVISKDQFQEEFIYFCFSIW